jgi:hypothetical protein
MKSMCQGRCLVAFADTFELNLYVTPLRTLAELMDKLQHIMVDVQRPASV